MASLNPNQAARSIQASKAHQHATGTFGTTARGANTAASGPSRASRTDSPGRPGGNGGPGAAHDRLKPMTGIPTAPGRQRRKGTA